MRYQLEHGEVSYSIYELQELGYLNENDPMFDEWWFHSEIGSIDARSTSLCELGEGIRIRFDRETGIFSGDGFDYSRRYHRTLGKDRSLNLLAAFAPDEIGETTGELQIRTFAGEEDDIFQEDIVRMNGNGLSSSGEKAVLLPESILLNPPFPNPFNSTTVISFQTPFTGSIRGSLVDGNGRIWANWTGMQETPGFGKFLIDGTGLPTGAYWVRIAQEGQSASQRIVLMK